MAFRFSLTLGRCTFKSMQNACVPHRCIVIPPNVGEPTRTNQEVIHALTTAIIGGMHTMIALIPGNILGT